MAQTNPSEITETPDILQMLRELMSKNERLFDFDDFYDIWENRDSDIYESINRLPERGGEISVGPIETLPAAVSEFGTSAVSVAGAGSIYQPVMTPNGGVSGFAWVIGTNSSETINGNGRNEKLIGKGGQDILKGNGGYDIASYISSGKGVVADLSSPWVNTNDAAGDRYYSIEGLEGSQHRDILRGDSKDNRIFGLNGNDDLVGHGGNDVYTGGNGYDNFYLDAGADTITDFENNVDTVKLNPGLWGYGNISIAEIASKASVQNGNVVIDFGKGNSITFWGESDINSVLDDLESTNPAKGRITGDLPNPTPPALAIDFDNVDCGSTGSKEFRVDLQNQLGRPYNSKTEGAHRPETWTSKVVEGAGRNGSQGLEVELPGEKLKTGIMSAYRLEGDSEYYASYWLKFESDFEFNGRGGESGGKLPGLAGTGLGEKEGQDGRIPSGGMENMDGTSGFSARMSWGKDGVAELYLYSMDKAQDRYGDEYHLYHSDGTQVSYQAGEWHQIVQHVRMGEGDQIGKDELEIWMDGEQLTIRKFHDGQYNPNRETAGETYEDMKTLEVQFRSDTNIDIDRLSLDTFNGGSSDNYKTGHDASVFIDDIVVSTDPGTVGLNRAAQYMAYEDESAVDSLQQYEHSSAFDII